MARTDQDMEPVSFVKETTFYLLWGGTVQLFWAVIAAPFAYLIASRIRHLPFHIFLSGYVVFNAFLLFWGCFGSYTFMAISFGKLYTSVTGSWIGMHSSPSGNGFLMTDSAAMPMAI